MYNPLMKHTTAAGVQRVYLTLTLFNTLAASFIWGINTLFLLDAGLNNLEAFAANAFFTAGQVLFEVPTGVVADMWGRRLSYLLGTLTLGTSTFLYLLAWHAHSPFWVWALTSALLGLGFTFFSGATEAWLVDALHFTGFTGALESVFAKGQIIGGVAMLAGSIGGGIVAQATNLGVPYVLRTIALGITFFIALFMMRDWGFTPQKGKTPLGQMRHILKTSTDQGFRNPAVRWVMLAAPFTIGVVFYAFYAMQPLLLQLYGNTHAYAIAGLAAAIVGGAQIAGGFLVPYIRKLFILRTTVAATGICITAALLTAVGLTHNFWLALVLLVFWGLMFAATAPVRQAYMNGLIASEQRATVLSFDNVLGSSGGVVIQPILGKVADVWGYSQSFLVGAVIQLMALPFILLAQRERPASDPIESTHKKSTISG